MIHYLYSNTATERCLSYEIKAKLEIFEESISMNKPLTVNGDITCIGTSKFIGETNVTSFREHYSNIIIGGNTNYYLLLQLYKNEFWYIIL